MSCGAALFNLRVAMRHFGFAGNVELQPSDFDPDLLATVRLGEKIDPSAPDNALFAAISQRQTHRHAFQNKEISPALRDALQAAAEAEGAWLHYIEGKDARHEWPLWSRRVIAS